MRSLRAGFSLIELVVVITLALILATIAFPNVNVAHARASGAARSTQMALASALQRAVLRQHDVVVEFDQTGGRLLFFEDANNNSTREAGEHTWVHALEETVIFGRGTAPVGEAGPDAVSFEIVAGMPRLIFHRSGSASEAGGFYLASSRAARSSDYGNEAWMITVRRATGRVRLHQNGNGVWRETF